jgi:hypothetical protein
MDFTRSHGEPEKQIVEMQDIYPEECYYSALHSKMRNNTAGSKDESVSGNVGQASTLSRSSFLIITVITWLQSW